MSIENRFPAAICQGNQYWSFTHEYRRNYSIAVQQCKYECTTYLSIDRTHMYINTSRMGTGRDIGRLIHLTGLYIAISRKSQTPIRVNPSTKLFGTSTTSYNKNLSDQTYNKQPSTLDLGPRAATHGGAYQLMESLQK